MNKTERRKKLLPNGIPRYIRCYDNGYSGERYTVVYTGNYRKRFSNRFDGAMDEFEKSWFQYRGMSSEPFHPQGIGMSGEHHTQIDVNRWGFAPAMGRKNHLGTRIPFSKLPRDCKKLVLSDYRKIWGLSVIC